jgi:hypothetical protein
LRILIDAPLGGVEGMEDLGGAAYGADAPF